MKRFLNILSTLLILAGIAVLGYTGFEHFKGQTTGAAPRWSTTQREQGTRLRNILTKRQVIKVPTALARRLPKPGSEPALRIVIPRIEVDAPVVETPPRNGVWLVADWAAGHLTTSPNPGAPGNDAISAHDDIKGEIFKRIGELRPGDLIHLRTRHATYTYVVTNQSAVDPSDISVLNPTKAATVTLISCTPYWVDTQRLIVQAVLKTRSAA